MLLGWIGILSLCVIGLCIIIGILGGIGFGLYWLFTSPSNVSTTSVIVEKTISETKNSIEYTWGTFDYIACILSILVLLAIALDFIRQKDSPFYRKLRRLFKRYPKGGSAETQKKDPAETQERG
jgi:hypothetical protein